MESLIKNKQIKDIIFLIVVIFTFPVFMKAQLGINIGGGANFSNISGSKLSSLTSSATNFYLSVRPEITVMKNLTVSMDIQFSRRGFFSDEKNTTIPGAFDGMRFDYLDLIPQIEYKFHPTFRLYTGLAVAIQSNEKVLIDKVWQKFTTKLSNSNDLAYIAGLRVFPIQNLALQVQYAGSLISLYDIVFTDAQGIVVDDGNYFFKNVQVGISYKLL